MRSAIANDCVSNCRTTGQTSGCDSGGSNGGVGAKELVVIGSNSSQACGCRSCIRRNADLFQLGAEGVSRELAASDGVLDALSMAFKAYSDFSRPRMRSAQLAGLAMRAKGNSQCRPDTAADDDHAGQSLCYFESLSIEASQAASGAVNRVISGHARLHEALSTCLELCKEISAAVADRGTHNKAHAASGALSVKHRSSNSRKSSCRRYGQKPRMPAPAPDSLPDDAALAVLNQGTSLSEQQESAALEQMYEGIDTVAARCEEAAAAISQLVPAAGLCNNTHCTSMVGTGELKGATGEACVCGGCKLAR